MEFGKVFLLLSLTLRKKYVPSSTMHLLRGPSGKMRNFSGVKLLHPSVYSEIVRVENRY